MAGLVVEGGAMRGVYTDGVLDALLKNNIQFPYIIGVSAGISNAYSYASGQIGRNWEIIEKYRNDKRYFGIRNYFHCKSVFGLDFVYYKIPKELIPFDFEAFQRYPGKVLAGVTNVETGKAEYFDKEYAEETFTLLRATCAIPAFFPAISFHGKKYYDGGLVDPIPIHRSIAEGNEKNLIVLTREPGYQKTAGRSTKWSARFVGKKYPALRSILLNRHLEYNKTVQYCEQLEREGNAVIIRPKRAEINVSRFEKDTSTLRRLYEAGFEDTTERMAEIKRLFERKRNP